MNKFLKVVSIYNVINVIIAYLYEFIKIPAEVNRFAYLIASVLGIFINVFSYVVIVSLPVSIFAVIYYLIRSVKEELKSEPYTYMAINLFNIMSMAFFLLNVISQFV